MKAIKCIVFGCLMMLFSCKEQPLEAQKTVVVSQASIEKIAPADLKTKIDLDTVQLIDVRTPKEYSKGHIANAQNINFYDADFLTQLSKLDKNKPVYLYCKSGGRSAKASKQLQNAGFSLIYDLKGGFVGWKSAGLPIKN